MDDYPVNKGHLEVITKRHIDNLFETTKEERNAIFELLEKGKLIIEEKYKPDGYNIGINQGTAAGQTIMHIHILSGYKYGSLTAVPTGIVTSATYCQFIGFDNGGNFVCKNPLN